MFKDFSEIMQTTEAKNAVEVAQSYKLGFRFKNLMGYAERMGSTHFFNSTTGNVLSPPPSGTNAAIHSHPNHAFPSNTDISSIAQFNNLHGYIYFQPKHNSQPQLYHYDSKYYYMIY
jgi:hypothetical protein